MALFDAEIALYISDVCVLGSPRDIQRVTWRPSASESGELFRTATSTVDEYRDWLKAQAYSAVLFDGAMVQLSFDFLGTNVVRHRLVYYPCPFDVELSLLKELPLVDVIDLYIDSPREQVRLVCPLRFDYDYWAQSQGHPASHLTFLSQSCRWAVSAPLSLGHFVRFIFRHFYPSFWVAHRFLREWPQTMTTRTITASEESMVHISRGGRLVDGDRE